MKNGPIRPDRVRAIVFDADGVLVHGKTPHPGAIRLLDQVRKSGRKFFILTNNSSISRSTYAARWRQKGFDVKRDDVITSGYLTAQYFKASLKSKPFKQFRTRSPHIFVVGGAGIAAEFKQMGINATLSRSPNDRKKADFVISGIDRTLTYAKIARAQEAIREEGALFIATNQDPTFPTETGFKPGAGVSIAAISMAAGKGPDVVVGKPNPLAMEMTLAAAQCGADEVIMVGDRLDTDIEVANRAGVKSVLVLSGSTSKKQAENERTKVRKPGLILKDINAIPKLLGL